MLRRIWLVAVFAAPALGGTHPSGASIAPGADGRLWLTDAFFDHVTRALRPVISDMICNLPMKQIAGGEKLIEAGMMEITILDLDIADCSLDSLNIRSSQGGILVALGGLDAASRGKVNARQLGWPYVEMEAKFTAEFNGHMSLLLDLFTTDAGKLALHIRDLQVDIHLSDINMLDFRGLNSFSSMLMFVIEAAAGAFTEKRITKVVSNITHTLDLLPFDFPVGGWLEALSQALLGRAAQAGAREAELSFRLDNAAYAPPAWRFDTTLAVSGLDSPQSGAATASASARLPAVPPPRHISSQVIGALSLKTFDGWISALGGLGLFSGDWGSVAPSLSGGASGDDISLQALTRLFTGQAEAGTERAVQDGGFTASLSLVESGDKPL